MKKHKALLLTMLLVFVTASSSVFALDDGLITSGQDIRISRLDFEKIDPVKELKTLKSKAQEDYKQGRISKDELELRLSKIDRKLDAIKEFSRLSLEQKKDRLVTDFKKAVNKKVQEGKITENESDRILQHFTETVNQWDGQGFPSFYHRKITISKKGHSQDKEHELMHKKHMHQMHMKFVEALDKAVKEGVIDESQKKKILQYLHESMKEIK